MLPTRDQFLPYPVSPEGRLYAPLVSPVTPGLRVSSDFSSAGSSASMDCILAEDVDLVMDST